jgi:hypothetical protein
MGKSKYNKDTYIGYLKMKDGGMKVIPGHDDNKIIEKRDKILNHLERVFIGEKRLKEKNIEKYFKALGGKYVRNDMCITGDSNNCNGGQKVAIKGAHKLLKLSKKKDLNMDQVLNTFKGSAPVLYKKFDQNIKGGRYNTDEYVLLGGQDTELNNFRIEIGRPINLKINNLRDEILSINL